MMSSDDHSSHTTDGGESWNADRALDFLCHSLAHGAEGCYPVNKAARDASDALGLDTLAEIESYRAKYAAVVKSARVRFNQLQYYGIDPQARAQREAARKSMVGTPSDDIDWSWWEADDE